MSTKQTPLSFSSCVKQGSLLAIEFGTILDKHTSFQEAERLKIEYGQAQVKLGADQLIKFQQIDNSNYYYE
jgi:hypothetical protein